MGAMARQLRARHAAPGAYRKPMSHIQTKSSRIRADGRGCTAARQIACQTERCANERGGGGGGVSCDSGADGMASLPLERRGLSLQRSVDSLGCRSEKLHYCL